MKINILAAAVIAVMTTTLPAAYGCSRCLENKYETIVSGRSMDWAHSFDDYLLLFPRGMKMDGGATSNSVEWTSKYGSVVSSIAPYFIAKGEMCKAFSLEKDGASDGMNEAGLGAHLLYLGEEDGTVYANASTTENINLSYMRWVRYVLDNFATVEEAVQGMMKINTIKAGLCFAVEDGESLQLGVHMAVEDATGDSAVFEHVGGVLQVYHNRTTSLVMTNEPPYDKQNEILATYEPWGGNISLPENLPGSVDSMDRRVRLEYYLQYTPEPKDQSEAIAYIMTIIAATNVPFGAPYQGGVYPTWWTSFMDLTKKIYYFNWLTTPNLIWVDLQKAKDMGALSEGKPMLKLKPQNESLVEEEFCDFADPEGMKPDGCVTSAEAEDDNTSTATNVSFASAAIVSAAITAFFIAW